VDYRTQCRETISSTSNRQAAVMVRCASDSNPPHIRWIMRLERHTQIAEHGIPEHIAGAARIGAKNLRVQ